MTTQISAISAEPAARRRIMTVLFVGVFMAALDAAVVAPAIPALRTAFGVDNSQIGLMTIVFGLCSLSSTALMANLSDRFGRRPIYLVNVALFAVGSLIIAIAPSFGVVLLGRAIQGFSAGGITPAASAVVGDVFPPEERGKALGLIGATFGMAFLLGPIVASLILVALSWPWIFLLNLPVAAVVLALGMRDLPATRAAEADPPFDWAGIIIVTTVLTSLMLGINRVLDRQLGLTLWPALLGLAAIGVPLLIGVERRAAQPIVPLSVFRSRQLALTYLLTLGAGFGMGSVIFISSVAVAAFSTPPDQAGFLLLPLVLASSAGSVGFGRLLNRLGARNVLLWGFGTLAAGAALLGVPAPPLWLFLLATVLFGLGVGIVVGGTLRTIVLDEAPPAVRGAAQGLINIGISVGNLLAVAALGAVADRAGLYAAYLACAAVTLVMIALTLGIRRRG